MKIIGFIVKRWIQKRYGKLCKYYIPGCGTCDAWLSYYYLFEEDKVTWDSLIDNWVPLDREIDPDWLVGVEE